VTSDSVLDETMTRLFASAPYVRARRFMEGIFESSHQGLLDIEHIRPNDSPPHGAFESVCTISPGSRLRT
jgi:hypothetical protein